MADPAAAAGHSGGSPTAASPSGSGSGSGSFSASSGGSGSVSGQGSDKKPMFNTIRKFMGTLGRKSEPHLEVAGLFGSGGSKELQDVKFEDFAVKKTLGTGSFGRVLLVQQKTTGKHFAMKVLKKAQVVKLKQVEHTMNERNVLKMLDNPFTVNLLASFQDDSHLFMVMDYVPGGEMFSYLRKQQKFDSETAKYYAAEIVVAFELMHAKDILYRDLKPENILIDSEGHIRITDFGFGKVVPDITWTLCGTPDYLAPEIIQSKGYGKAVDWYSLGVLIYEMLAGYPPYADDDPFRLYEKILAGKLRFPSKFDPDAKDLCKKLMTADLTRRYGNLKNGSKDIRNHKWFANVDWKKVAKKQVTPPIKPIIKEDGDSSNYDEYEEDHEPMGLSGGADPYRSLFAKF